jgi:hypothetical protein
MPKLAVNSTNLVATPQVCEDLIGSRRSASVHLTRVSIMTAVEMNRTVSAELERIPKHPKEHQSRLRAFYPMIRRGDLGKNGDPNRTPGDALRDAIAFVRTKHPDAALEFDRAFFGIE